MSSVPGGRHLRSARRGELDFPRARVNLIWLRTWDGCLPTPVSHLGTLYLTVSRTLILLCKPSNAISRPSYFPHTSTFSAFEVSYKNALYKSTVAYLLYMKRHIFRLQSYSVNSKGFKPPNLFHSRLKVLTKHCICWPDNFTISIAQSWQRQKSYHIYS